MTYDERVDVFMHAPEYRTLRLWAEIAYVFRYNAQPTRDELEDFVRHGSHVGNFWQQAMRQRHG